MQELTAMTDSIFIVYPDSKMVRINFENLKFIFTKNFGKQTDFNYTLDVSVLLLVQALGKLLTVIMDKLKLTGQNLD